MKHDAHRSPEPVHKAWFTKNEIAQKLGFENGCALKNDISQNPKHSDGGSKMQYPHLNAGTSKHEHSQVNFVANTFLHTDK